MQQIRVCYENGVFVPLEHIDPGLYEEAIVTVKVIETEKKSVAREKAVTTDEHRARAKAYIEENFPDVEVSQEVMDLTGILRDVRCDDMVGYVAQKVKKGLKIVRKSRGTKKTNPAETAKNSPAIYRDSIGIIKISPEETAENTPPIYCRDDKGTNWTSSAGTTEDSPAIIHCQTQEGQVPQERPETARQFVAGEHRIWG